MSPIYSALGLCAALATFAAGVAVTVVDGVAVAGSGGEPLPEIEVMVKFVGRRFGVAAGGWVATGAGAAGTIAGPKSLVRVKVAAAGSVPDRRTPRASPM